MLGIPGAAAIASAACDRSEISAPHFWHVVSPKGLLNPHAGQIFSVLASTADGLKHIEASFFTFQYSFYSLSDPGFGSRYHPDRDR